MSSFKQLKERRDARQIARPASETRPDEKEKTDPDARESSAAANCGSSSSRNDADASQVPVTTAHAPVITLEGNADIHIKKTETKGRGLFWCPSDGRRLGRGTAILQLDPEMTIPSLGSLQTRCHRCFHMHFPPIEGIESDEDDDDKDNKPLQRCSGCKTLYYCSATCQRADWPSHRPECKALQMQQSAWNAEGTAGTTYVPATTVRMMARLIWDRQRRGPDWWELIDKLQANRESVSDPELLDSPLQLARYLGASGMSGERLRECGLADAGDILDLVSRVSRNTFTAYTSDLNPVGISLSSQAAMLNHSCAPNVAVVFPDGPGVDRPMHVVALRDVEPGDELTTFYVDVSDPYEIRQRTLQRRYGFQCRCDLCKKSEEDQAAADGSSSKEKKKKKRKVDPREAIWCGRQDCTGWIALKDKKPFGQCTKCKQECTVDANEIKAILEQGIDVLKKVNPLVSQGRMLEALALGKRVMKNLTRIQPPSAYPLFTLLCQLQGALAYRATESSGTAESSAFFEEAIRFHILSLAGMQASNGSVYCEGHPERAISLATLSTLLIREVASEEELEWHAEQHSTSEYLTKVPSIPPVGTQRDQAGMSLMLQAINEVKIAYGIEGEGGKVGRELIDRVREYNDNESMLAMGRP